ncbi:hypothetical protein F511_19100 [Dorcoceras hygrometricum]|uniref:Uncharacterized protein n=1 Tax=Dorcoceras hygrometricum TaxID=472368 RepID=A0A2Z7AYD3_9LAMI|nr:hypothetical protein F511_19100 [Dorcoceras hygrometricum]
MESSLIQNTIQVKFDSVLSISDEGMVVVSAVSGKFFEIEEDRFVGMFNLPTEGLTSMEEVPKDLIFDAKSAFSAGGEQVKTSCKKREMKKEFRLMNDILAKTVTIKVGSFDAVTHERFILTTAIHLGLKINWSKLLFNILKDMGTPAMNQAKGFAPQICALLKGAPDLTLGECKTFPPLKILTVKTVGTYVAKHKTITAEEYELVEKVTKKAAAKRRPAPAVVEPAAKKKRTTVGRSSPTEKNLVLRIEHAEPIGSLGLNGAGEHDVDDITPTDGLLCEHGQ